MLPGAVVEFVSVIEDVPIHTRIIGQGNIQFGASIVVTDGIGRIHIRTGT